VGHPADRVRPRDRRARARRRWEARRAPSAWRRERRRRLSARESGPRPRAHADTDHGGDLPSTAPRFQRGNARCPEGAWRAGALALNRAAMTSRSLLLAASLCFVACAAPAEEEAEITATDESGLHSLPSVLRAQTALERA